MRKSIAAILTAFAMMCFCVGCAVQPENGSSPDAVENGDFSQELVVLKSDAKVSQEDTLSRIKAEYLKENGGYSSDDVITVFVTLEEESLSETYLENGLDSEYRSVAEYAESPAGKAQANAIASRQNELIKDLFNYGLITKVKYKYSALVNAIAVETTYGNFSGIGSLDRVSNTYLSDTYNRPQTSSGTDASAITNDVNVYPTGIFNSSDVSYTGKHTAVAVLDSGFDCSHSVFANQPDDILITKNTVESVLAQTNAAKFTNGIEVKDVWYSNKIPFTYDYADKDNDVFPYDSEHGTHVAGIIGGKDDEITGVAVDTQLVLLKVFPDLKEGAETEDILAALEDAMLLEVDAINMSLGSSCGFAREEDGNFINDVYDRLDASGISLVTAASNSYNSAFGGAQGNTNLVTNPDSGTVGSPSTYAASLSVASVSGVKSKYLIANGSEVVFYNESNSLTGKENNFFDELYEQQRWNKNQKYTLEYVTIPGSGVRGSYLSLPPDAVKGKVALIRRGDNTFEEKALLAKNAGAIAAVIYNNIDGDILMSMGKTEHIPTISISKEMGTILASQSTGTIEISYGNQAGPFMSDFSSWGPSPNLELKPEITAHGGNIHSSVPGGGYDDLSGTSMASPNLCGVVVLIRQYLKERYEDLTWKEISVMTNQMLMSTATIVLNEEGNPYSPRKQGAGLANLYNVVNTDAYLTVDGIDRTKLELKDDPNRTGVYTMTFNVVNISNGTVQYDLSVLAMTETVSSSDEDRIAEKGRILGGNYTVTVDANASYANGVVSVEAGKTAKVTVKYTLSQADKDLIEKLFPYGMYVEGFVKLAAQGDGIDLNIPFLAFYGDWTQAPIFDKTYYEVESEAHDKSIDDEDKLKADYYATTPYGSYYYNYIIPLGTYLYTIDESTYDAIPASEEHIALSNMLGTIDGFSAVYAGVLRNADSMKYTITDNATGEVLWTYIDNKVHKAYSQGGSPIPSYEFLNVKTKDLGLINNHSYEFKMYGVLDYGDGGVSTNARNTFSFNFTLDDEAPVVKSAVYEKKYDKTLKKDRYYVTLTLYDNQYVMSVSPVAFMPITEGATSTYTMLSEKPIPVYSKKGTDNTVRIEITDYLNDIGYDRLINSAIAFYVDDYALNQNIFLCQLPGTRGDFKFTNDGTADGGALPVLPVNEGEVVDLTDYLYTADKTVDANKDYLKYLVWKSTDERIAVVEKGQVLGVKAGRVRITVTEQMYGRSAQITINVKARAQTTLSSEEEVSSGRSVGLFSSDHVTDVGESTVKSIRFAYFDTVFAYSRAAQTSEIGQTGERVYISSLPVYSTSGSGTTVRQVAFYPGEQIQLRYDLQPWYVADKYTLTYSSGNPDVAKVDENGKITALKEGSTTITLRVEGSNLSASLRVTVNNPFVIENRTLVAYKGLGGKVEIPDDEGIVYIGAYAFCLYTTDRDIEVSEEDYDANKIPASNTAITEVVIPKGVEDIQKYAFYNCTSLRSVTVPDTVKYIREYAFYNDKSLTTVDLSHVYTIGAHAFEGCEVLNLTDGDLEHTYAVGVSAFENCISLAYVDLTALRNTGIRAFRGCKGLRSVTLTENTKLSKEMFAQSGLVSADVYETVEIPAFCFAQCENLERVTLHKNLIVIGEGAFCENPSLTSFEFGTFSVESIGAQVFYECTALTSFTLPDCAVSIGDYALSGCSSLTNLVFGEKTELKNLGGSLFSGTAIETFTVSAGNTRYAVSDDGHLLLNAAKDTVLIAATGYDFGEYTLAGYQTVGASAFSGAKITKLTISDPRTVLSDYAFARCTELTEVVFPAQESVLVGAHAFDNSSALVTLTNLTSVKSVGDYAFARTGVKNVTVGADAVYGEGAFFQSALVTVTVGANTRFGLGAFQRCTSLATVNMPEEGGVHIGPVCFAYDTALINVDLSKTDNAIEREAFFGCTALQEAKLANVEYLGDYAFAECASLAVVTLPKVVEIGEGAFAKVEENGNAAAISALVLPSTLRKIGAGAFLGCFYLTSITVPDSVEELGSQAFALCTNLESVTLPASLTVIGNESFLGCEALTTINLGGIREIGDFAFYSALALENVDLSSVTTVGQYAFYKTPLTGEYALDSLTQIGDYAFFGASLTGMAAPNLETVGYAAFMGNLSLREFVFGDKIGKVDTLAFNRCTSLENFAFMKDGVKTYEGEINAYARLIDGVLYTVTPEGKLMLTSVPGAKNVETLTVVEGTELIGLAAGNGNTNVTKIVLPDSMKIIENFAFYGYTALTEVEFRSSVAPVLDTVYATPFKLYQLDSAYYNLCVQTTSGYALVGVEEGDPGYELVHNQFDLFGYELTYYQFIGLAGKYAPVRMILPSNSELSGYDGTVYRAYFGEVASAERSDYVAREKNLIDFIAYAEKIAQIPAITGSHEALISKAVVAMNALKQSGTEFGYSEEEWKAMLECVTQAKAEIFAVKIANSRKEVRDLQAIISGLPTVYTKDVYNLMKEVETRLAALKEDEREIMDLSNYEALVASYNGSPNPPQPGSESQSGLPAWAVAVIVVGCVLVAGGGVVAVLLVKKKRANAPSQNGEGEDKEIK